MLSHSDLRHNQYIDKDVLKSAPLWNYDKSMRTIADNYETPIDKRHREMSQCYMSLYPDVDFKTLI